MPTIDRDTIYEELLILVRKGAEPGPLAQREPLLQLVCVRQRPGRPAGDDSDRALGASPKKVLYDASMGLSGWKKDAARNLFGLAPGSGAKGLMERDALAGACIPVSGRRFGSFFRDDLIRDLADAVWEREQAAIDHTSQWAQAPSGSSVDIHGYKCISTTRTYTVSDDDPHFHIEDRVSVIEITKPGVTEFQSWYQWSGSGRESDPVALSPGHAILRPILRLNNWKYYYVDLGGEQKVGARVEIHTQQNFEDEQEDFDTFYTLAVHQIQQWQSGALRVRLPDNLKPHPSNIEFLTYDSYDPTITPIAREPGQIVGPASEIFWALPQPLQVGYRYQVKWWYDHGGGIYLRKLDNTL